MRRCGSRRPRRKGAPRGLKALIDAFGFGGEWHWEIIVTDSVITTVPLLILFAVAQRQIVQGLTAGGLKG